MKRLEIIAAKFAGWVHYAVMEARCVRGRVACVVHYEPYFWSIGRTWGKDEEGRGDTKLMAESLLTMMISQTLPLPPR